MIWKGVVVNETEKENVTEGIVDVVDQAVDLENDVVTVEGIGQDQGIGIGPLSRIKGRDQRKEDGDRGLILERKGEVVTFSYLYYRSSFPNKSPIVHSVFTKLWCMAINLAIFIYQRRRSRSRESKEHDRMDRDYTNGSSKSKNDRDVSPT